MFSLLVVKEYCQLIGALQKLKLIVFGIRRATSDLLELLRFGSIQFPFQLPNTLIELKPISISIQIYTDLKLSSKSVHSTNSVNQTVLRVVFDHKSDKMV